MHRFCAGFATLAVAAVAARAADWFQFRGPTGQGHADAKLATEWDAKKNVTWRKELPGGGWSSPVLAGGKVYLTAAVPQEGGAQSLRVLCLDARTGDAVWDKEVFKQPADAPKIHSKNSHASPTAVVEDGLVYAHFGHMGTACLKAADGVPVWATQEHAYKPVHGNGGSPVLAGGLLAFCADGFDKQLVVALDKKTGKTAWTAPRKLAPGTLPFSFCTPLVIRANGTEQLIAPGSGAVMALDPKTGKELWRARYPGGYSVVPRPVYANGLVYVCTGYNTATLLAVRPDGTGDVTDTHVAFVVKKNAPHNPSPVAVGDALYMVSDKGVLSCLDGKTGKERWSENLNKPFSASLTAAGGLVYATDEAGTTTVFRPGDAFDPVATNKLNEKAFASFGVEGAALFLRTEKALYRIEAK